MVRRGLFEGRFLSKKGIIEFQVIPSVTMLTWPVAVVSGPLEAEQKDTLLVLAALLSASNIYVTANMDNQLV